jgi:hypothetical protein
MRKWKELKMKNMQSRWKVGTFLFIGLAIATAGCMPIQRSAMQSGRQADRQVGAQSGMTGGFADVTNVDEQGNTTVDHTVMQTAIAAMPVGALTTAEKDGLLWMREEEKLAHDVYVTLYEKWNLPIFQNISQSELTHTDAVKSLLDRYSLDDPAVGKDVGVFVNPTLQGLYDQLVAQGSQSLADALVVGATIEDLDIVDLQTRPAQTDKADIQLVYANLMKGSRNHLRAFTQTLTSQTGQSYTPQYLDQVAYEAIINSPTERGQGRGR